MVRRLAAEEPSVVVPFWRTATFYTFVAGTLTATAAAFEGLSRGMDAKAVAFGWFMAVLLLIQQVFSGQQSQKAAARAATVMRGGSFD